MAPWGALQKRRLADAHDVWLLGGAWQKRRLADAHDVWLLGVPGRTVGLLMLMMFGSGGAWQKRRLADAHDVWRSLGCPAETQAC